MTLFNGLVGIDLFLAAVVASTTLSWSRPVLIHQFDGHGGFRQFKGFGAARAAQIDGAFAEAVAALPSE